MVLAMFPFSSIHSAASKPSESTVCVLFYDHESNCLSNLSQLSVDSTALMQQAKQLGLTDKCPVILLPHQETDMFYVMVQLNQDANAHDLRALGTSIYKVILPTELSDMALIWPDLSNQALITADQCGQICQGLYGAGYQFTKYLAKPSPVTERSLTHVSDQREALMQHFERAAIMVQGEQLTKDLMHEPPNMLTPAAFAERITALTALGLKVDVMDEKQLLKENMHALLSVGQGSTNPPRLVTVRWCGKTDDCKEPFALVGKGICFDSGGIDIKLSALTEMKYDMGGAATVIGAMQVIARLKLPINVVGVVALAENMPGGKAYRPSDIISSRAGKSIEVLNTDAEGRLILADALDYACDMKPSAIVDLATLTGAIIVSLGHEYAGFFSNDDTLADRMRDAADQSGTKIWQLPLDKVFDRLMDSPIADVQNLAKPGSGAGSITAAQFLQRFVRDIPWAHIDIAGTAWIPGSNGVHAKGPTAYGVSLLVDLVNDQL